MAANKKGKNEGKIEFEMEQLDKTKIKLTIKIGPERFREGLQQAYNKNKNYFNLPGFRKGKAPRKMIEQMYGKDIFYDDAVNYVLPEAYEEGLDKYDIEPVYKPELEPGEINEASGAEFVAIVSIRPEVEVGDYLGLTYPKVDTVATEEDIDNAL
ncbi:MAG: trigger factor family protein, partial [Clostridiales bacterium]|nr:trigger factor family protein [Clostridiales bacterium]